MENISDMITTIDRYSGIAELRMEGIDVIIVKYKAIVEATKKKNYDILEHKKSDVSLEG